MEGQESDQRRGPADAGVCMGAGRLEAWRRVTGGALTVCIRRAGRPVASRWLLGNVNPAAGCLGPCMTGCQRQVRSVWLSGLPGKADRRRSPLRALSRGHPCVPHPHPSPSLTTHTGSSRCTRTTPHPHSHPQGRSEALAALTRLTHLRLSAESGKVSSICSCYRQFSAARALRAGASEHCSGAVGHPNRPYAACW